VIKPKNENKMTIGEKIRHFRELKNYSQENMAEMLQISVKAYARIERNQTDVSISRLNQIANVLGANPLEIMMLGEKTFYYVHTSKNEGVVINNGSYQTTELKDLKSELEKCQIVIEKQNEEIEHLKKIVDLMSQNTSRLNTKK
jgi:transcriptional regulator with XRE-family HTH domain